MYLGLHSSNQVRIKRKTWIVLGVVYRIIWSSSQCRPNLCIFRSGKPRGSGFWVGENRWVTEGTKRVSLRASGSRGGRILTQQGGFQVSRQGEQGAQGADHVHKSNFI